MASYQPKNTVPGRARQASSVDDDGSSVDPYFWIDNISSKMSILKRPIQQPATSELSITTRGHQPSHTSSGGLFHFSNCWKNNYYIWDIVIFNPDSREMELSDATIMEHKWFDLLCTSNFEKLKRNLQTFFDKNFRLFLKVAALIQRFQRHSMFLDKVMQISAKNEIFVSAITVFIDKTGLLSELQIPEPAVVMDKWVDCYNGFRYFDWKMRSLLKRFMVMQLQLIEAINDLENQLSRETYREDKRVHMSEYQKGQPLNESGAITLKDAGGKDQETIIALMQTIEKHKSIIESNDTKISTLEAEIEKLKNQIKEKESDCDSYRRNDASSYTSTPQQTQQQIIVLHQVLETKVNEIVRKDEDLRNFRREVESLKKKIEDCERRIKQYQIRLHSNESLKIEYESLKSKLTHSEKLTTQFRDRCDNLNRQIQEQDQQIKVMNATIVNYKDKSAAFQNQITDLKKSKEELLTRLSKLAGEKLTDGNPDITDLSDENRPTKLAEKFSELYDNEWTDSLEELLSLTESEVKAININLDIVSSAYTFCNNISKLHADQLIKTLQFLPQLSDEPVLKELPVEEKGSTIPQHIKKDIEDIRMVLAPQKIAVAEERFLLVAAKVVQKHLRKNRQSETLSGRHRGHKGQPWGFEIEHVDGASGYLNTGKQTEYGQHTKNEEFESASSLNELLAVFERIPSTKVFAKRCAHLCWLMRIRDPKLHMLCDIQSKDNVFDTEKFRYYTRTGKRLDFVVWPALFLYENGPLLSKGVAQASS